MKIGNHEVTVQRDPISNEGVVHVVVGKDEYTTFRYSPLQAASMTMDKLEKMVNEHLRKG